MDGTGLTPPTEKAQPNDDDIDADLWASPSKTTSQEHTHTAKHPSSRPGESAYEREELRNEALKKELDSVRRVNAAIEGVIESLGKARDNMKSVNDTVGAASSLLNTWTRILSRTEYNQRLILNPIWQGASQDVADMEQEVIARQQAMERKEFEEQHRRELAARKAEDDERKRAEAALKTPRGSTSRGRVRGASRVAATAASTYSASASSGSTRGRAASTTRRVTSDTGKISMASRSRGRG